MADSNTVGFLLFCTLVCTFFKTPEVQAQNSSVSAIFTLDRSTPQKSAAISTLDKSTPQKSVSPFLAVTVSSTHGFTQIVSNISSSQFPSPQVSSSRYLVTPSSIFGASSNESISTSQRSSSSSLIIVQQKSSRAAKNHSTATSPVANHSTIISSTKIKSTAISTRTKQSSTMTSSQVTNEKTITITPSKSQPTSSSVSATVITPTTSTPTKGSALFSQTEYILTACLVVFFFVLIATVALVIQIALLHKSLKKLKAKSHR